MQPTGSTTPSHICLEPLSEDLPKTAFSASSSLPENKAKQARSGKNGWIPEPSDGAPYLDVDFPVPVRINGISVITTAFVVSVKVQLEGTDQFELVAVSLL